MNRLLWGGQPPTTIDINQFAHANSTKQRIGEKKHERNQESKQLHSKGQL